MVLVDANVLLYAVNADSTNHLSAKAWIERALSGDEPVGLAWVVLLAFLRVATMPAFAPQPLSTADALDLVADWLSARAAVIVSPTDRHEQILGNLIGQSGTAGNLVTDCHLAALAIEHGARICTFDRDLARFEGVRSFSPEPFRRPVPGKGV